MYAVSHSDNIVVAIDPATYRVAAVAATGPAPAHVIEAPNGKVYVTNTADGTVSVYQAPGLQPVGRIQLGDMPHGLRAAAGGSDRGRQHHGGGLGSIDLPPTSQWGAIPVGPGAGPGRGHPRRALRLCRHHQSARGGQSGFGRPRGRWHRKGVGLSRSSCTCRVDEATVLSADQGTAQQPGHTLSVIDTVAMTVRGSVAHRLGTARRGDRHLGNQGVGDQHLRQHGVRHRPTHPVRCGNVPVGTEPAGISYSPRPPAPADTKTTQLVSGT